MALKRTDKFACDSQCQEAFDQLKEYLKSLLMLTLLTIGEPLYLYLIVADEAISAILIKEESEIQYPVYYVS